MLKRAFDLTAVLLTAPVWVPVLLVAAVAIRIFQHGPVFFVQERAGRHGVPFRIFKFRTMSDERDASGELLDDAQRITTVGNIVRKTSVDEIPQLLNVLKGDMSLVGPRPLLMEYLPLYSPKHRRRHEVLPGITGLAQVNGRNLLSWDERLDLDVRYVDTCGMWTDLRILLRTVLSVVRRHGVSSGTQATMHKYRGPGS